MLWFYGFLAIFVIGGLTGVMVAVVPFGWQAHDTHFVVAHLHYVLIGGFVFPMIAAVYYWLPHLTGRRHMEGLGRAASWITFLGFNATFLPMHLTGLLGMPRRVYTYADGLGWSTLKLVSSVAGFATSIGFALVLVDVVQAALFGQRTPRDPWGAGTLDWAMPTPPTSYDFGALPDVRSREPVRDAQGLPGAIAGGEGYLATPRHGWQETLGVHMIDGTPDQVTLLPKPTRVPLYAALSTGLFFVSFLFGIYWLAALGAGLVVVFVWAWMWDGGLRADPAPLDIGVGPRAMPQAASTSSPTLWGMVFTLMADGTLFGSLIFGYLFLWTVGPDWPPPALIRTEIALPAAILLAAAGGLAAALVECAANRAGAALLAASAIVPLRVPLAPGEHAYAAVCAVIAGYLALHAGIGALLAAYAWARAGRGWTSALRAVDVNALALWWMALMATTAISVAALYAPVILGAG